MAKLLLIEDEKDLVRVVQEWMDHDHHLVDVAHDGALAVKMLAEHHYDLVILDLGLPDVDGLEIIRDLRERGCKTPIIVVTGRNAIDSKVVCLEGGADDYLTKPFHMKELSCRVRALIRRDAGHAANVLRLSDVTVDLANRLVAKCGSEIKVTPQEFALLDFSIRHPNCSYSTNELLSRVWHTKESLHGDTVRQCVKRLRQKLGDRDGTPLIETTAAGYRFYAQELMLA
jgi:DNA-binding response OmpR family regulator